MGTDQLHKMAYHDTVERFHILTHVLFVWAQNVENAEESLWLKFFYNAGMVFFCEMIVDVIKHSFLAKFNEVKPATYSQFLQALCTQTLNSQSHEVHKTMAFVPLAPACVVMRILFPVYASCIPEGPFWWKWPVMMLLGGGTYAALFLLKIVIGLSLQIHARWYLKRHPWKAPHPHHE
ncbi:hypothetical protein Mapa_011630 [Marchantia paleacea]|nr:hypothetical protein Mapa_011630 [Marchantia paleacea]